MGVLRMRFPINEETKKPYGMPKGVKPQDEEPVDLDKVNKQRLALESLDVETRAKAMVSESGKSKKEFKKGKK